MKRYAAILAGASLLALSPVGLAMGQGRSDAPKAGNQDLRTIVPPGNPNDPNSPASSNRGDPGTEPINPNTGGPTLGQGEGATNPAVPQDQDRPATIQR